LFTSRYVLSETAKLFRYDANDGHAKAVRALEEIRNADSFRVLRVDDPVFDDTCERFERCDDRAVSFVDRLSGALCASNDIEHVFTNGSDDFETLRLTVVP
jgi:predicted nucleic acid-binding protein